MVRELGLQLWCRVRGRVKGWLGSVLQLWAGSFVVYTICISYAYVSRYILFLLKVPSNTNKPNQTLLCAFYKFVCSCISPYTICMGDCSVLTQSLKRGRRNWESTRK